MTHSRTALLIVAALWLAGPMAHAARLGSLTVLSKLGQPLVAEIEILALQPSEEKGLVARLAPYAAFKKAGRDYNPALRGLRMSIKRPAGRRFLRLTTSQPVNDTFFDLLIELHWSTGRVVSNYTVLLDPPGYQGSQAIARVPAASAELGKPAAAPAPKPAAPEAATPSPEAARAPAVSRDELFGLAKVEASGKPQAKPLELRGFIQNYTAYDYKDPTHWSRAVIRTQLGAQGGGNGLKWKATFRLDLDPVYAGGDFHSPAVRKDQRRDLFLRETYIDTSLGGLELRIGKQNIVWGEMVGLFFADVVSARDQRDFILPDFEIIRIPQWAVRAEYFGEKSHAELIWLPYPEVDNIGKPGAEFFPFRVPAPMGFSQQFNDVVHPSRTFKNSNLGVRLSTLQNGWDLSAFYYRSTDVNPTFYRNVMPAPTPILTYTPRHDRIWQAGGTLGKDFGSFVGKAEVIYSEGRKYNVTRLSEPTGVVPQDTVDYVVGLDFTLPKQTRLNLQYFERVFFDHDPDLLQDRRETGVSLLLSGRLGAGLEPELLIIQSVNRRERLVRAKLGWSPAKNWRLTSGIDVFTGPATGLFGRFDGNDRVYVEARYDF